MIYKRAAYRVVRTAVDIPAVRALAVREGGFRQLERRVRAYIFDVVCGFGLVGIAVDGQWLWTAIHAYRQILLVAILLVLDLGHRGRFAD